MNQQLDMGLDAISERLVSGPLAIGGVGGSGTRVLFELFRSAGFDMGRTNQAGDNLLFSLIFKRPRWLKNADDERMEGALNLFEKLSTRSGLARLSDWALLAPAIWERTFHRYNFNQSLTNKFSLFRPFVFASTRTAIPKLRPVAKTKWGWKEPNTHLILDSLARYFCGLRYIHVMRNGLDMAFSGNQNQVRIWGDRFSVSIPENLADLPGASLAYWVKANRRAIAVGSDTLGDRFMVIRFEELCAEPEVIVPSMIRFAGVDPSTVDLNELIHLPRTPKSVGRYREHNLSIFDPADLQAVADLGYPIRVEEDA